MRLNENMFQTIVTITTYNLTRQWSNIDKRIVPFHTYRQIYARRCIQISMDADAYETFWLKSDTLHFEMPFQ